MNTTTHLFTYLGTSVDTILAAYVSRTAARVSALATPLVASGLTLWILWNGLGMVTGASAAAISQWSLRATKMAIILAFALSAGVYQDQVVGSINGLANDLVSAASDNGASTAYGALDALDDQSGAIAIAMVERGEDLLPVGGYVDILVGILMVVANAVLLFVLCGHLLLAKVSLALTLALGPAFIAALAFSPTARLFTSWSRAVLSAVVLFALTASMGAITVAVYAHYLETVAGQDLELTSVLRALGELLGLVGALTVVTLRLPALASSITEGAAHGGFSTAFALLYTVPRGVGGARAANEPFASQTGSNGFSSAAAGVAGGGNESSYQAVHRRSTLAAASRADKDNS